MTYKQLREKLTSNGKKAFVRWNKSGIVEFARVTDTGSVQITNVISKKSYHIPRKMNELDITVLDPNAGFIKMGDLLPKSMR